VTTEPSVVRRALVTGATRGIGKAIATALAGAGWDVAITGRTRRAGEGRDHSDTGEGRVIPGSLDETAAAIRSTGRSALPVVADLHDHRSLVDAVDRVMADWGGVDLLVNNAVDTGPGSMVPVLELPVGQLQAKLDANVVAPLVLVQAVLPGMIERGGGTIVNVTSHTATADPPGPVGKGGWGLGYAASKAAVHRFAPLLAVELGSQGIRAFNLDPGYVETERQLVNAAALGLVGHYTGAPPSVPAAAVVWMADHPGDLDNGQTVRAQKLALTHGLHPDWRPAP
jgi:NAD(P)-dependent dehydrogenase (short-subunit alcohol dehydrogenase family)